MSKLYYKDQLATLVQGDCLNVMKKMPDNSVDAIVTDPPYGINFMGKKWDYDVPTVEVWKEALRVLKPGGHILCACGTRTQHRMAVNLEDAGFEIRDIVAWVYGSGFPKSMNVGKAVDKFQGNERDEYPNPLAKKQTGQKCTTALSGDRNDNLTITKGTSKWEGWGTALKPAMELFTLARKPLSEKTVAENVLKWGTGGINIDGCRVPTDEQLNYGTGKKSNVGFKTSPQNNDRPIYDGQGRFPANIIFDETAGNVLDEQSGIRKSGGKVSGKEPSTTGQNGIYGHYDRVENQPFKDSGGASRFFYCAKASKSERNKGLDDMPDVECGRNQSSLDGGKMLTGSGNERSNTKKNFHPTVKPIKLMEYLITLITPKGGTILDPFVGSGTTLISSNNLHIKSIGIELEEEYCEIAKNRLEFKNSN